ncbi:hypothetical protein HanXRQr2_Chr12g0563201 [Helianthus annuus]|uniref:Uncharacterized protein n=1 Tax=Helianthus annuus TaxID=4232 RepID=A0A9K3MYD7_HELAN|nr:hypothetical protein HanXRQr2_Chr12g0563201 [Helianthus annuus]KAJ0864507.1 hypothetical protein HanPSC8_Chr12g0542731 [Helianthus annuus]
MEILLIGRKGNDGRAHPNLNTHMVLLYFVIFIGIWCLANPPLQILHRPWIGETLGS